MSGAAGKRKPRFLRFLLFLFLFAEDLLELRLLVRGEFHREIYGRGVFIPRGSGAATKLERESASTLATVDREETAEATTDGLIQRQENGVVASEVVASRFTKSPLYLYYPLQRSAQSVALARKDDFYHERC